MAAIEDTGTVSVPGVPPISEEVLSVIRQELAIHTDELFGVEHYVFTREILWRVHNE